MSAQTTSVSSEQLVTPFVKEMVGNVRVVGSNLTCNQREDGQYLYRYQLRVQAVDSDGLSDILGSTSISSNAMWTSADSQKSRSKRAKSTDSSAKSAGRKTSAYTSSSISSSAESLVASLASRMAPADFMILINFYVMGDLRKPLREDFSYEFPSNATLRTIIQFFNEDIIYNDRAARGEPRFSMCEGRLNAGNSTPVKPSDLDRRLDALFNPEEEIGTMSIIADIS